MAKQTKSAHALLFAALLASPAQAAEVITCTGKLSETATLAVIADPSGHTCSVDLRGSGHDPMRPCSVRDICRLTGHGHHTGSTGRTYAIDEIIDVDIVSQSH
jgi:hypothetical protein